MNKTFLPRLAIAWLLAGAATCAVFARDITSKSVQFAKGASSATVKGSIKGYQIVDYKLRAKAGQTMKVVMQTSNLSNNFNVLPPGSNDVAIFTGSISGNEYAGALPADGEYTIRVYLMRSAARRNETASYTLSIGITGSASGGSDAKVPGTPYHATGKVPCSMGDAPAGSQQCSFGVIRGQRGYAEVEVTPPGGFKRVLIFDGNKVSAAGGDARLKSTKRGDTWSVEVNDHEHYEVPEAVISGG